MPVQHIPDKFALMFEFNGEIFYKVFEVGKIPSYMDPSKKYNESYIQQVASNYDPENVHEAPFWVGHPDWRSEPRAGGWVKNLAAIGKELYASFSEMSDWMKELYNSGEYKKCSVEMGDLEVDSNGTVIPYLWAIGATNIPAVKGLPVLKFKDEVFDESKLKNKVSFSLLNFDYKNKFETKKNTEMESLKKLAASLGIDLTGKESEAELMFTVETKLNELKASHANAVKTIEGSKKENALKLVDGAIESGQLNPAQRDEFTDFAIEKFSAAEKIISALPKKDLTGDSKINGGQSKFSLGGESKDLTYEEVLKEPGKFIGILSEEKLQELRDKSKLFA